MSRHLGERSTSPGRRVIPLIARAPEPQAATKPSVTLRDRVAWLCLGLGILCGAGAVYCAALALAG
ncbi:MAG: hypothetical protein ACOY93_14745 [Bacillota bacterium]